MNGSARYALGAFVILVAASACVSTQAARLGSGVIRTPVPPDQVAIYRTPEQVPRPYEEVAILTSTGDYAATDEEKMYRSMRHKAGELGANGVILQSVQEPGTGAKALNFITGIGANRRGKAIAIYVLPDTAARKP